CSPARGGGAWAARFEADGVRVAGWGSRGVPTPPSRQGARRGAKLGFDCPKPFGRVDSFEFTVAAPPVMPQRARAGVEETLAQGPASFLELMAATGTRDGREILLTLDKLYGEGRLGRSEDGRYMLKGAKKGWRATAER